MSTIGLRSLKITCACLAAWALAGCSGSDSEVDETLVSEAVTVARLNVNSVPRTVAHLTLPFSRDLQAQAYVNVVIDLNGDGKWAAYPLSGGTVQTEWVVRNLPVIVGPDASQGFYFRFGDARAMALKNLPLRAVVTPEPLAAAATDWDGTVPPSALSLRNVQIAAIGEERWTFAPNPYGTVGDGAEAVIRKDVPDRKQAGGNECVPTATANSLRWLAAKNPAIKDKLPASDADLINELKTDMQFDDSKGGVDPKNINAGKQAFIKRRGLPIDAHQVGEQNDLEIFQKILAELKKGQDVEIVVKFQVDEGTTSTALKRHMVTVVGASVDPTNTDGTMTLHFNDPLSETKGAESQTLKYNEFEKRYWLPEWRGMGGFIEYAFADSPMAAASTPPSTTPPATTTTAPPPATLKVTGQTSYNVTHVRGVTACPTPIGSLALQNTGGLPMNVNVGGATAWLDISGASAVVPAGGSVPLAFQFNCSNYTVGTQSTTLSIQATDSASGAGAGQAAVSITLTVQ